MIINVRRFGRSRLRVSSLCAIAGLLFSNTNAYSAEILLSENKHVLFLNGEIKKGDYQTITQLFSTLDAMPRSVALNSPGGDIEESIKIGTLLRSGLFQSYISKHGQCNSSCFILWTSGVRRFPASAILGSDGFEGKLGLHRPFYDRGQYSSLNPAEARSAYEELEAYVRAYLLGLKVPSEIVETMFRTKSTNTVFISDLDMIEKLGQEAPFFEEWLIAKCGELSYEEGFDYDLLMAASLMQAVGTPLTGTTSGYRKIESMSAGYKKYLYEKGSKIDTCRQKVESDETLKVLSSLRENKNANP